MVLRAKLGATVAFSVLLLPLAAHQARSAAITPQYRAAMTQIFLWQYHAFPVFTLNPVFPGDVIRLDNETIVLDHRRCYPNVAVGRYVAISPFVTGLESSVSIGASVKGELLSDKIAEIDASGSAKFADTMAITINPLAQDRARDVGALRQIAGDKECQHVLDLLDGTAAGDVVVYSVLHGIRNFSMSASFSGNLSAGAKGELLALIEKAFSLKEVEISVSRDSASFTVSESPGPMSLAVVPAELSADDVFWVVNYLEGKRGAELKIAVDEAIQARRDGIVEEAITRIRLLFGDDYARAREIWARRFSHGGKLLTAEELNGEDFEKIARFGAAMELADRERRR
jgi:hypothetical protein